MGIVRDNAGVPVSGAVVTTTPGSLALFPSGSEGAYAAYVVASASTYTADWGKSGYGDLPLTGFSSSEDAHVDAVLPPTDNVVRDWGFESGSLGADWVASGLVMPAVTNTIKHTGNYAALLGKQIMLAPALELAGYPTAVSPQLAVDGNRVVHLVWGAGDYGNTGIYYVRRATDGRWSTPQDISQSSGEQHGGQQLAIDKSGAVHVVWSRNDVPWSQSFQIYYARRGHDGTWSAPQNISNTPGRSGSPQLAVEESGVVHVAWTHEPPNGASSQAYYARRGSDGIWSSPISISFAGSLMVDASGTVHLTGSCALGGFSAVLCYIQRTADGAWSDPQEISHSGGFSQLAVDASGAVHVIWRAIPPGSPSDMTDIYYARRTANGSWSSPYNISNNADLSDFHQLAVSEDGVVHVVWLNGGLYGDDLYYARREGDGTWSSHAIYTADLSFNPQLALDGRQVLHVVWGNGSYDSQDMYYVECDKNGVWSTPRKVSNPSNWFSQSQLAVEEDGTPHIVWQGYNAGPGALYYVGPGLAEQTGDSVIAQAITMPISISAPILSILYQYQAISTYPLNGSWFNVRADNGITITTLFSTASRTDDWTHRWFDLSQWAGQTITLTFNLHQQTGDPASWAYLDEVTIGSAYPGLYVNKTGSTEAPPGGQVVYVITYGNEGGAAASQVWITDTWPNELILVDAQPSPSLTTTSSLGWDVGSLLAKSGPLTITITATVAPTATMWHWFTNTVSISTTAEELETANNVAQAATFVLGPDVWVSKKVEPGAALPGEKAIFTINYANLGKASADDVWITDTLPAGLLFVTASPSPDVMTTSSLVWKTGSLSATSGSFSIVVTTTVAPTATLWATLTNTASIATVSPELETGNNIAQSEIFVGRRTYLPSVFKK